MKKDIGLFSLSLVLFIASFTANSVIAATGDVPLIIGLILSVLLACSFIVFPLISRNSKLLIKLYSICMILFFSASLFVMLAERLGLQSEFVEFAALLFAIFLTPFYGIRFGGYVDDFYYPSILLFSAFCLIMYLFLSYKRKKSTA